MPRRCYSERMTQTQSDNLVSAKELSRRTGIPVMTIRRMADKGRIPSVDKTEPWHERKFLKFDPDAVRAALGMRAAS